MNDVFLIVKNLINILLDVVYSYVYCPSDLDNKNTSHDAYFYSLN